MSESFDIYNPGEDSEECESFGVDSETRPDKKVLAIHSPQLSEIFDIYSPDDISASEIVVPVSPEPIS